MICFVGIQYLFTLCSAVIPRVKFPSITSFFINFVKYQNGSYLWNFTFLRPLCVIGFLLRYFEKAYSDTQLYFFISRYEVDQHG